MSGPTGTLTIEPASFILSEGEGISLKAMLGSTAVAASQLTWTVSPSSIGSIDSYGNLTAVKHGEATVTARYSSLQATSMATVWAIPEKIEAVSGLSLSGIVGRVLSDSLSVRAVSKDGVPVPGVGISFEVLSGEGTLSHVSDTTGTDGAVRVDWALGVAPGEQQVRAVAGDLGEITFLADAIPDYDSAQVVALGGDGQDGEVASFLPEALRVLVTDQFGNDLPGLAIEWNFSDGGGVLGVPGGSSSTQTTSVTDGEGITEVFWELGTIAGEQEATCEPTAGFSSASNNLEGNGPTGAPTKARGKKWLANAHPAPPADVSVNPEQTWTVVGASEGLSATVVDPYGNVIGGGTFKWSTDGSGIVDVDGLGNVTGLVEGTGEVVARSPSLGLEGSGWVTVEIRRPSAFRRNSGDGQKGTVGKPLPSPVEVLVIDQVGAPVVGVSVQWSPGAAAPAGGYPSGPSPSWESGSVGVDETITDENGIAQNTWTLGPELGQQALQVRVEGLPPVEFTAEAGPGDPVIISLTPSPAETRIGKTLQFTVSAQDAYGNQVPDGTYVWTSSDPAVAESIGSGLFRATAAGSTQVRAVAGDAQGSASLTVLPGGPADAQVVGGNNQSAPVGTLLPVSLTLGVLDETGGPIEGETVHWSVAAGNGSVGSATSVTNATGEAEINWTLGTAVGDQRVSALVGDLPATVFSATAAPGPIASVSVTPASLTVQESSTGQLSASARDQYGNAVDGGAVSWNSSNQTVASVDQEGMVRGRSAGMAFVTAEINGIQGRADVAVSEEPVDQIEIISGDGQSGPVGSVLQQPIRVRVSDASGAPIDGYTVEWEVLAGSGKVTPSVSTTDSGGFTETNWTLGADPGQNSASASFAEGGAVVFTATGEALPSSTSPETVQNLTVAGVTDSSVTLTWTEVDDGTGAPASYDIRVTDTPFGWNWGDAPSVSQGPCALPVQGQAVGQQFTCTVEGLSFAHSYDFRLVSFRGTLMVDAVFGGLSNIATGVTGSATTELTTIVLSPGSAGIEVGRTQQFTAAGRDQYGNPMSGINFNWSSSNSAVATVSESGLVTSLATGSAQIQATSGGISGSASITVISVSSGEPLFSDGFESGGLSHTENGFIWQWHPNASVKTDRPRSGNHSFNFKYMAQNDPENESSPDAWSELRFDLGANYTEVWMEYYLRIPDNYVHPNLGGPTNNKQLIIYGSNGYPGSHTGDNRHMISFNAWHGGTGSYLNVLTSLWNDGPDEWGRAWENVPYLTEAMRGNWVQYRWHFKASQNAGDQDAEIQHWLNGNLVQEKTNFNYYHPTDNGWRAGYLMGWHATGYSTEQNFHLDDFKVYTSDPGW